MGIVKKEIDYAKEVGDVGACLEKLVAVLKKKEKWGDALDELVAAVDGISGASDEIKENRDAAIRTMGYHMGGIVDALLKEDAPAE